MAILLYTDGAATMRKENGEYVREAGGWAFAEVDCNDNVLYFANGHFDKSTNNECELTAINKAIKYGIGKNKAGKTKEDIVIYSDSAYCINIFTQWAKNWESNGWTRGKKHEKIENLGIIKDTWELLKNNIVVFVKVKGHSNNKINNFVDKLAVEAKLNKMGQLVKDIENELSNYMLGNFIFISHSKVLENINDYIKKEKNYDY